MAAASDNVRRLQQLTQQAVKEKISPAKIVARIEDSLNGAYQARGYSADDKDMALLVLRLGGRKLLYALSQYISLPSIRILRRSTTFTKLMPSLDWPTINEVQFNIKSIFEPRVSDWPAHSFRTGVSVCWDELSVEECTEYHSHTGRAGNFCREHAHLIDTRLLTFENALSIARALYDGVVHRGKEASVIALTSFSTHLRGSFPVLVSPTCKKMTTEQSAKLFGTVLQAWQEFGAKHFGPIWSFASDGDAGRRQMIYQVFMKHTINMRHSLYKYLGRLRGLNLQAGDFDITPDIDWKHELKCMFFAYISATMTDTGSRHWSSTTHPGRCHGREDSHQPRDPEAPSSPQSRSHRTRDRPFDEPCRCPGRPSSN